VSALEAITLALGLAGTVVGSLALVKLRGKAPPNGDRLR